MTPVEYLVPDTDAVARTYAILFLRYLHPDGKALSDCGAWTNWLAAYGDHMALIPAVVHTGTDDLWQRKGRTGVWLPTTEAGGSRPTALLDRLLREHMAKLRRKAQTEAGQRLYMIQATPMLLGNICRELVTLLKEHGRVVDDLSIHSVDPDRPLPCTPN